MGVREQAMNDFHASTEKANSDQCADAVILDDPSIGQEYKRGKTHPESKGSPYRSLEHCAVHVVNWSF